MHAKTGGTNPAFYTSAPMQMKQKQVVKGMGKGVVLSAWSGQAQARSYLCAGKCVAGRLGANCPFHRTILFHSPRCIARPTSNDKQCAHMGDFDFRPFATTLHVW
jgi:hypothetical protein